MARYTTKQRRILLDFFSSHTHETLCAKEIADAIGEDQISTSAVYRNLAEMEEDGLLKRTSKAGSHEAFFQYTDNAQCFEQVHLSCKCCNRVFHMSKAIADRLFNTVAEEEGFAIDRSHTVLVGICKNCRN